METVDRAATGALETRAPQMDERMRGVERADTAMPVTKAVQTMLGLGKGDVRWESWECLVVSEKCGWEEGRKS